MIVMTREKAGDGWIQFWYVNKDSVDLLLFLTRGGFWKPEKVSTAIFDISPDDFRLAFPNIRLPRKGSKKIIKGLKIVLDEAIKNVI